MSELTVNELPLIRGRVLLYKRGPWRAQVVIDANEPLENPVVIERPTEGGVDVLFVGAFTSSEVRSDRVEAELVGGAGNLDFVYPAKAYNNVTVQIILQDLVTETREQLSPAISQDILSRQFAHYTRAEGRGSQQLDTLADLLGVEWRVQIDGTLWLGVDTWQTVEVEHDLLADNAARNSAEIATDEVSVSLLPGVTFNGRRVSFVEHDIEADRLRTCLLFERADSAAQDAAKGPLRKLIESVTWQTAYHAMYAGRVVYQHASGEIDVVLDDASMPGLSRVKILSPFAGSVIKVAANTRILIGFVGGNPTLPVATLWDNTTQAQEVRLNAGTIILNGGNANVIRAGDSVNPSANMATWFLAIQTATGVAPPTGAIGTSAGGNGTVKA